MKVDARGLAFEKDFHVDFHQFICLGPPMADSELLKINSSAKGRMRQKSKFLPPILPHFSKNSTHSQLKIYVYLLFLFFLWQIVQIQSFLPMNRGILCLIDS
jgi:hypothetical protein